MKELKNVKGTNDYGEKEQILRNYISDTLRNTFEKYGYKPLSTSILCYYDLLSLKYDENNDILKEIYTVKDQINRKLALRYDLTVPFAKYISLNRNINFPYKRYEIGKVFRDGPIKKGRAREFIQCDVDCVGIDGQMIEAELISLFVDGYNKLGIDIIIKYNNRKIMSGIIEQLEIPKENVSNVITVIDKFEKLSKEDIKNEFRKLDLDKKQIDKLIRYLNMEFDELFENFKDSKNQNLKEGINEIINLNKYINVLNLDEYVRFTPTLARGQEYYTGTVFEVYKKDGTMSSSIGGGGRYDEIIGNFIGDGKKYPAVGISFGLDAIFAILKDCKLSRSNNTDVYIIPMNNEIESLKIAKMLRQYGKNVDIEMSGKKLKKALNYANIQNIPWVIITGEDEMKMGKVIIKNMQEGIQEKIEIDRIKDIVAN